MALIHSSITGKVALGDCILAPAVNLSSPTLPQSKSGPRTEEPTDADPKSIASVVHPVASITIHQRENKREQMFVQTLPWTAVVLPTTASISRALRHRHATGSFCARIVSINVSKAEDDISQQAA
jgi:hypothetical protein